MQLKGSQPFSLQVRSPEALYALSMELCGVGACYQYIAGYDRVGCAKSRLS
jgi:hypothetical protein